MTAIPMNAEKPVSTSAGSPVSGGPGIVSSGWLAANSSFGSAPKTKMGRALATSIALHGGLFAAIVLALTVVPQEVVKTLNPLEYKFVFLPEPGKGGGGGGSPAPAPKKQMEIPKHTAPSVAPVPVSTPPPEPPPTLVAPIQTNSAMILQSAGNSSISLAPMGGGGSGGGIGSGKGNGVGDGTGGGFGGGAYAPGSGVSWPKVITEVKPKYTPDAMRAKLQGAVELEIVVKEDGTVGDVRVTKSLDRASGLDDAAMAAARKWLFSPGMKEGKPVPTRVGLVLEFRLH